MRRTLPTALLMLVALAALAVPALAERDVIVPRVEGILLDVAVRRIESANLQVDVVWSATGRPGHVQAQHPSAGERVPPGTIVELVVSRRVQIQTLVPDVVGLDEREAVAALEDVYALELVEEPVRPLRAGEVVATEPAAGARLPLGGALRLLVGRARRPGIELPVPDLQHMLLDEAESTLLDLGLVPVPTFVTTRRGAHGRVRRQDPDAGVGVTHGARVALEVGIRRGPGRRVRVPSLYGLRPAEAAHALDALGLAVSLERLPSRFAQDTVIRQNPRAGTEATPGSTVRLVVAFPAARTHVPARVQVPRLEGLSLSQAFAHARRAGIRLAVRRHRELGPSGRDVVLSQRPTALATVPLGTRVEIGVPFGGVVPDLVGLSAESASLRALQAGLQLRFESGLPGRPGSVVVAQAPDAGTVVPAGSALRVVLARDPGVGLVLVPELTGLTVEQARERLRAAGLHATLSGPPVPLGSATRVVAHAPTTGTRLPRGSDVRVAYRLAVDARPTYVLVPDLRGLSLLDAHRALAQRGLEGIATTVRGPGAKGVTGQSPTPGTRVLRGIKVRFTVRR